jgi:hypothetical protein
MIDPSGLFGVAGIGISMSIGTSMQGNSSGTNITLGYYILRTINFFVNVTNLVLILIELDNQLKGRQGGNPPPDTAVEFLHDWITGEGQPIVVFTENTYFVQDMKNHSHVQQYRDEALNKAVQGTFGKVVDKWYSYSGFNGIPIAIKDALGMNGAWASAPIVGSYGLEIITNKNVQNNSVIVQYKIINDMGLASATRFPVIGYLPDNHPLIRDWGFPRTILNDTDTGPMKNKTMILIWEEEIPLNAIDN